MAALVLGLGCGTAAAALAPLATAQDMGAPDEAPMDEFSPERTFVFMDIDKNGKVTVDEVKARAKEMDKALQEAGQDDAKLEEAFKSFASSLDLYTFLAADADDNLELTKAELETAMAAEELKLSDKDFDIWAREEAAMTWPGMLEQYDANKDGVIERTELGQDMAEHGADFDASDGNKDGKVTADEFVAYIKRSLQDAAKDLDPHEVPPPPAGEAPPPAPPGQAPPPPPPAPPGR